MFVSIDQICRSLPFLEELNPFFGMSFLAFKKAGIPVGEARPLVFSKIAQDILDRHYKPLSNYAGFYTPFKTSDQSNRWTAARYASTTLQRITSDTFGDTLIHKKKESVWGWKNDYLKRLKQHLDGLTIPAFHLGVWLFRDAEWPSDVSAQDIVRKLFFEYRVTDPEIKELFDHRTDPPGPSWISERPVSENELLAALGNPPGWAPPAGAALHSLEIREVGPANH